MEALSLKVPKNSIWIVRQGQMVQRMSRIHATTPGQSGPESNGKEWVPCISQSSCITGVSSSDCLVSYQEHFLKESYFAEMQSVDLSAPADWVKEI